MTDRILPSTVADLKADIVENAVPAIEDLLAMFPDEDESNYGNLCVIWNQLDGLQDTLTEDLPG